MSDETRWTVKFQLFCSALIALQKAAEHYEKLNELELDGLVQRFEFTFDLAWKTMQDYIAYQGYTDINGPRPVLSQVAQNNLIDPFVWGDMLKARNELSHIYDEELSRKHISRIATDFLIAFVEFKNSLEKEL